MARIKDEECGKAEQAVERLSAVELLKAKRSKVAREMTARLRDIDRGIRLAEETDAENVMRETYRLIDEG